MIKLYTPQAWTSLFRTPSLIIEDDGLMYSESEYYDTFRTALGKIDYSSGYIYGRDYLDFPRYPIGKVIVKNGVTEIYGSDYDDWGACPVFYVQNDKVFTYDEYHRLFRSASGYIDNTASGTNSYTAGSSSSRSGSSGSAGSGYSADYETSAPPSKFGTFIRVLLLIAVILVILGLNVFLLREAYIVNDEYADYLVMQILSCGVGSLLAMPKLRKRNKFVIEKWDRSMSLGDCIGESLPHIYQTACILFWLYMSYRVYLDIHFAWYLIFMVLLCVPISMLLSLIPTGLFGIITGFVVFPFLPKVRKKRGKARE